MKNKKRLMFIKSEDYNYLTYSLLLILKYFEANSENNLFIDYRKLVYLIYIISDRKNINILSLKNKHIVNEDIISISPTDKLSLMKIFYEGSYVSNQINQLVYILENKGYIGLVKVNEIYNIYLKESNIINELLGIEDFDYEKENLELLKGLYRKISTVKYDTFMNNLFYKFGVEKCDI